MKLKRHPLLVFCKNIFLSQLFVQLKIICTMLPPLLVVYFIIINKEKSCFCFCRTVSRVDVTAAPGEKPSVGAQKGGSPDDGSQKKTLAIIIPLALIGTNFFWQCYKIVEWMYKNVWREPYTWLS